MTLNASDIEHIGRIQLLFATGIEHGIHERLVLKYPPSVTFKVIFHHLIPLINIEYWNITHCLISYIVNKKYTISNSLIQSRCH